ncbi:hypothetical protein [Saccharopolyspora hattusasensis]|uniref:hypothetical protein n=1 Tax=Saccharopolyspora hattusasensis TaxID=1128679 RepID=UPI003D9516BC
MPAQALGSRDPQSQAEWVEQLGAEEWVQLLQLRTRRRLYEMVHCLAAHADWETWETWPTWDRLIQATGWARSTMAGWLRQLRVTGWISVIEHGSTPQFRPMGLLADEGNRAAVYALRVPLRPGDLAAERGPDLLQRLAELQATTQRRAKQQLTETLGPILPVAPVNIVDKTWTPTVSPFGETVTNQGGSYAREKVFHNSITEDSVSTEIIEALRARFDEGTGPVFADRVPVTRGEMLAAATELRQAHLVLARLSAKWVRNLCRPYWQAGWTNRDIEHALEYRPTSWSALPAMPAERVVVPARWIAARLAAWRDEHGRILPGRSQHRTTIDQLTQIVGNDGLLHALGRLATDSFVIVPGLSLATVLDRLTPEAIQQRGRRDHQKLRAELDHQERCRQRDAETAPTPRDQAAHEATRDRARATLATNLQQRTAERARAAELRHELLSRAQQLAALQKKAAEHQAVDDEITHMPAETPEERRARALQRARRDGHAQTPRRHRATR